MPSRNSVNKPKLVKERAKRSLRAVRKSQRTTASKVTTKVISKKRAKKDQRNIRYTDQLQQALQEQVDGDNDTSMQEEGSILSSTQRKRLEKQSKAQIALASLVSVQHTVPSDAMEIIVGQGTTLGHNPLLRAH